MEGDTWAEDDLTRYFTRKVELSPVLETMDRWERVSKRERERERARARAREREKERERRSVCERERVYLERDFMTGGPGCLPAGVEVTESLLVPINILVPMNNTLSLMHTENDMVA
jgi:hypothetical protein